MLEEIKFIPNSPAILIKDKNKRILIISDLHLGIEHALDGLNVPSQTQLIVDQIIEIIEKVQASELILLGDIKHSIPQISPKEWYNIPKFFEMLSKKIAVKIIRGNHDGDIDALISSDIGIYNHLLLKIDNHKIGLIHGHIMIPLSFFDCEVIIMGHNHPTIKFQDKIGINTFLSVWVRTRWDKELMAQTYLQFKHLKVKEKPVEQFKQKFNNKIGDPEIIIMPPFNRRLKGFPINKDQVELLGPLGKSIKLKEAEIITLDGTYIGKLAEILFEN